MDDALNARGPKDVTENANIMRRNVHATEAYRRNGTYPALSAQWQDQIKQAYNAFLRTLQDEMRLAFQTHEFQPFSVRLPEDSPSKGRRKMESFQRKNFLKEFDTSTPLTMPVLGNVETEDGTRYSLRDVAFQLENDIYRAGEPSWDDVFSGGARFRYQDANTTRGVIISRGLTEFDAYRQISREAAEGSDRGGGRRRRRGRRDRSFSSMDTEGNNSSRGTHVEGTFVAPAPRRPRRPRKRNPNSYRARMDVLLNTIIQEVNNAGRKELPHISDIIARFNSDPKNTREDPSKFGSQMRDALRSLVTQGVLEKTKQKLGLWRLSDKFRTDNPPAPPASAAPAAPTAPTLSAEGDRDDEKQGVVQEPTFKEEFVGHQKGKPRRTTSKTGAVKQFLESKVIELSKKGVTQITYDDDLVREFLTRYPHFANEGGDKNNTRENHKGVFYNVLRENLVQMGILEKRNARGRIWDIVNAPIDLSEEIPEEANRAGAAPVAPELERPSPARASSLSLESVRPPAPRSSLSLESARPRGRGVSLSREPARASLSRDSMRPQSSESSRSSSMFSEALGTARAESPEMRQDPGGPLAGDKDDRRVWGALKYDELRSEFNRRQQQAQASTSDDTDPDPLAPQQNVLPAIPEVPHDSTLHAAIIPATDVVDEMRADADVESDVTLDLEQEDDLKEDTSFSQYRETPGGRDSPEVFEYGAPIHPDVAVAGGTDVDDLVESMLGTFEKAPIPGSRDALLEDLLGTPDQPSRRGMSPTVPVSGREIPQYQFVGDRANVRGVLQTPVTPVPPDTRLYKQRTEGLPPSRPDPVGSIRDGYYYSADGKTRIKVVYTPEELDRHLRLSTLSPEERALYEQFRQIQFAGAAGRGGMDSPTSTVARGLRRPRRLTNIRDDEYDTESDSSTFSDSSYSSVRRRPVGVARPNVARAGPAAGGAGGLRGVFEGARRNVPPRARRVRVGEEVRLLARSRYQPPGTDPSGMRTLTFTDTHDPGKEEYDFQMSARKNDPFYAMGCKVGAIKRYIGDYIMLCVEHHHINIVIYRLASLGSVLLLIKKLKFHVKGKGFSNANLVLFGGNQLFSRQELLRGQDSEMARTLYHISRRAEFTRLVLENSSGGPFSEEWFHTYKAHRVLK